MINKKAAMFGLDARIALAIFGALSVITGAALYSAIQNTKVTAYVTELNELGKAFEAYMLDTGVAPPTSPTLSGYVESLNLIENKVNAKGWKGPYLTGYTDGTDGNGAWLLDPVSNLKRLLVFKTHDFNDCTATDCSIWSRIELPLSQESMVKAIDKKIDGAEDAVAGSLVYFKTTVYLVYKRYNAIPYNMAF